MSPDFTIVIPCYNESSRLDGREIGRLCTEHGLTLLFVNDGSNDNTLEVLHDLCRELPRASVLNLSANVGKAEAVRQGMLEALDGGAEFVGYIDADLATPVDEVARLCTLLVESDDDAVIGSRIARLGATIERHAARHYLGRAFATVASVILKVPVYDTQCGAKAFRAGSALHTALAEPFQSRWAFDVELIGRLLAENARVCEVPLLHWVDIDGSKLSRQAMLGAGLDLLKIASALRRWRSR